ncbi:TolC family outer membrane protein [Parendozoicomonas sp. Alg238-R29]|uniref:TolC family outer membrane protein n=1 Tax=Parendozoicomonas sp. Alg238-R29 TaxID=2993446 RepID=UPI00248E02F2|nr:TolC family outer membrane protein [Parendozoicomonas sp. Alg238-R29]
MKTIKTRGLAFVIPVVMPVLLAASTAQAEKLSDVVATAIATNPEVHIRTTGADATTDEVRQARAGYLPSIDLTAGAGFENSRNATTIGRESVTGRKDQNRTRREAAITLRQIIFDGFATDSEVDRQLARKRASDFEVCSISEDIGLQATEAYTDVMRQQALVANAKANLAEHQRIVELIRESNKKGKANDADKAQAESRLLLASANLIATEASLRDSRTAFQRIVGNQPKEYIRPSVPAKLPKSEDEAINMAMTTHPVMRITMADVDEAKAQYEASKSRFMPTFTAELGADWGKDQNGGKGTIYNHTAMIRMSFNLYNGGADKARKSQTSKLINEAMEVRNRAVRQIKEEVRLSWIAVDSGSARLKQLIAHEQNALKALDLYNQQFTAGTRTLLDLLDSQNEYFSAGNSKIRADFNQLYSQYRLLHSGGVLLKSLQVAMPVENSCGIAVSQS